MAAYYFMNQTVGSTLATIDNISMTDTFTNDALQYVTCEVTTTTAHGLVPGQNIYISNNFNPAYVGDNGYYMSRLILTGYTLTNSINTGTVASMQWYWTLVVSGTSYTVNIYMSATENPSTLVASGTRTGIGVVTLTSQNSSGLSGSVTLSGTPTSEIDPAQTISLAFMDTFNGPQIVHSIDPVYNNKFTYLNAFWGWSGGIVVGTGGTIAALAVKSGNGQPGTPSSVDNASNYYIDKPCTTTYAPSYPAIGTDTIEITPGSVFTGFTYQPGYIHSGSALNIYGVVWLTVRRGGILFATGQDGIFDPVSSTFTVHLPLPGGNWSVMATSPPLFKTGGILKSQYSAYSFGPSLPLSDQTLPIIDNAAKQLGPFSLAVRSGTGPLTAPIFPPQVVPHLNGQVDGNAIATVTNLTVGRYLIQVTNPTWVVNDSVEIYVEFETIASTAPWIFAAPVWQSGGGTTPAGCGYRWYRTRVDTSTSSVSTAVVDQSLTGHVASGTVGGALVDKQGYTLSANGLDIIGSTEPVTGVAVNFPQMVMQLWRRFFKKATMTGSQLQTFGDDGNTVLTTQSVSDVNGTQTQGPAT